MIDTQSAQKILHHILKSSQFANSEFDRELLAYLANNALEGRKVKEITLAIDVFGKNTDFDPSSDSIVRTHIYSLRKKLKMYYLTEGHHDKYEIVIPKGRYEVEFSKRCKKNNLSASSQPAHSKRLNFILVCILLVVIFAAFFNIRKLHQLKSKIVNNLKITSENHILKDFMTSKNPLIITYGDYFAYAKKQGEKKTNYIRDGAINSSEEFQNWLDKNPAMKGITSNSGTRYITNASFYAMEHLFPYFKLMKDETSYLPISSTNSETLEENDIIFLGPIKTILPLEGACKNLRYWYALYPHRIINKEHPDQIFYRIKGNMADRKRTYYYQDYAIIAKLPLENNNTLLIITAFGAGAVNTVMYQLTNGQIIKEIQKKYLIPNKTFPRYFETLVKINHVDNDSYWEILDFQKILE